MKYLYYNGDSFCGDGVKRFDETFGQLLGDKYNLEVNHAWKGGSSNHRIHRTTVNHIMNNQSKLQDTLFLIGWTKPTRFELYNSIRGDYIQYGHQNFYNLAPNVEGFEYEISIEFQKEYISKFVDDDTMLEDHLRRVYSLESILKTNNCKYLFWNVFHDTCILHSDLPDTIPLWNKAVEIFDWENWILPFTSFDQYLEQFQHREVRQSSHDDHPNKLGHQKWFEVVSSVIDNKELL
jgi:hypothetical protein